MGLLLFLFVVLVLVLLARADTRNRSQLPTRSWNIWFGPKPRVDESRAHFTLRRALAAAITLVVLSIPLFMVSGIRSERSSFVGDESMLEFAVLLICAPLAVMAFLTLITLLFSALMSVLFRRGQVFDMDVGDFVRR